MENFVESQFEFYKLIAGTEGSIDAGADCPKLYEFKVLQ